MKKTISLIYIGGNASENRWAQNLGTARMASTSVEEGFKVPEVQPEIC